MHATHVATACYVMNERARRERDCLCLDLARLDGKWPLRFLDMIFVTTSRQVSKKMNKKSM